MLINDIPQILERRLPLHDFENLCKMNQVSPEEVLEKLNFLLKETGAFGSWDVGWTCLVSWDVGILGC